jgi:hypothetical protein
MSQLSRRAILSLTAAGVATTLASGCGRSTKNTGHHDAAYWRTVAPAELRFVGSHLH